MKEARRCAIRPREDQCNPCYPWLFRGCPAPSADRYNRAVRLTLLKNTLVWAMVSGLLLSPQLWLTERTYPHAPVIAGLGQIPAPWDGWCFALLLALLAVIVIVNRPRVLILAFVGLAAVVALLA